MNPTLKTLVFWIVIVVAGVLLWQVVKAGGNDQKIPEISYSEFLAQVEAGRVRRVTVVGNEASVIYRDGQSAAVIVPATQDALAESLRRNNVDVWFKDAQAKWPYWLLNLAPLAVFGTLLYMMMKQLKEIRRLVEFIEERRAEAPAPERADPK